MASQFSRWSSTLRSCQSYAIYFLIGIPFVAFTKAHVLDITPITGASMRPTLSPHEHETGERNWVAWKMWQPTKNLQRGDLVLFMSPDDPEKAICKRVIALGGDKVFLDPKRQPGRGLAFQELKPEDLLGAERWASYGGSLTIPYGHVWVEGDNRRMSKDSNDYGAVSKSLIIGSAYAVALPLSEAMTQKWKYYKSKTRVKAGKEELPDEWKD